MAGGGRTATGRPPAVGPRQLAIDQAAAAVAASVADNLMVTRLQPTAPAPRGPAGHQCGAHRREPSDERFVADWGGNGAGEGVGKDLLTTRGMAATRSVRPAPVLVGTGAHPPLASMVKPRELQGSSRFRISVSFLPSRLGYSRDKQCICSRGELFASLKEHFCANVIYRSVK